MKKFKSFYIKNISKIYNTELLIFLILIILIFSFQLDKESHQYFNRPVTEYNFHSILSSIMIVVFVILFWIIILYPVVYIIQILLFYFYKLTNNKNIIYLIAILISYLLSILCFYILISIDMHQGFLERTKQ
jgi:hypothetical protein